MALTPVATPQYPNVPLAPGVPPVKRDPLVVVNKIQLVAADIGTVVNMFLGPQWGIFTTSGAPFVIPDTVVGVDFRAEARVSDYPQEAGGFQSYDKVMLPYDARVEMVCTGEAMDKTVFLTSLEQARHGLDLYTVVTPEVTFPSVNIVHYDFRRTREHGATILFVEVWLTQIMNTVVTQTTLALTDTQNPDSQSNVSQGAVQPTQPQLLPGFVTNTQPIPGFVTNTQPLPGFVARPFGSG